MYISQKIINPVNQAVISNHLQTYQTIDNLKLWKMN